MTPFITHTGLAAPLQRSNVDTDQIIPKQFLKRIERTGFGKFLFYDWRFDANDQPIPDFILNQPPYQTATILIAGQNFGCGSSREHAPWALSDFGFRSIIAPSFADIFYNNCFQNGLLPVILSVENVNQLFQLSAQYPSLVLTVSLQDQIVTSEQGGFHAAFTIDPERREKMLRGLDPIGETLLWQESIARYEAQHTIATVPADM